MELQLGLALPIMLITTPTAIKAPLLDLNSSSEQSDASTRFYGSSISTHWSFNSNKRSSDEAAFTDQSDSASTNHTLSLLLCNKDDDDDCRNSCSLTLTRNGEEDAEGVAGTPPIMSCRKRQCGDGAGSLFVKAQMEGVLITRKIDLTLHQSYHMLCEELVATSHRSPPPFFMLATDRHARHRSPRSGRSIAHRRRTPATTGGFGSATAERDAELNLSLPATTGEHSL